MKKGFIHFLKVLGFFLGYLAAQVVVSFLITMGFSIKLTADMMAREGQIDQTALTNQLLEVIYDKVTLIALLSNLLCFVVIILVCLIRKKKWYREVNLRRFSLSYLPYLLILEIALVLLINCGLQLLPQSVLEAYAEMSGMIGNDTSLIGMIAVVIVAPIFEEIFFRGLMLSTLRKGMPTALAILLSSIIFGVAHGQILWIAYTFIIGLVFACIAIKTGSIAASMVLHVLFNFFGDVVVRYIPEPPNSVNAVLAVVGLIGTVSVLFAIWNKQEEESKDTVQMFREEEENGNAVI